LAGLPRGSHWFHDSRANPKRQAELLVQQLDGDFGELPLFADLEETYKGIYGSWQKWYDFLECLKTLVGKKKLLFTQASTTGETTRQMQPSRQTARNIFINIRFGSLTMVK
jgi:hypothetical protein